jgi:hypothetical protein
MDNTQFQVGRRKFDCPPSVANNTLLRIGIVVREGTARPTTPNPLDRFPEGKRVSSRASYGQMNFASSPTARVPVSL